MRCVILYRVNGGKVQAVLNEAEELYEFPNRDDAIRYALNGSFAKLVDSGQADYQIVELDEL